MKTHWLQFMKRDGVSTVELVLILSALVSVAILFKDSLMDFTERVESAEFAKRERVESMTFGGEVKTVRSRSATLGISPNKGAGSNGLIDRVLVEPIRNLLLGGRSQPLSPSYENTSSERKPEALDAVLNQFSVESSKRYEPTLFNTYCNIFAWDATSAMNAEIPHWINWKTMMPYAYDTKLSYSENAKLASEVNVNTLFDWMEGHAGMIGYREVSDAEARAAANQGKPAVGIWQNPKSGSSGHIVVLRPYDPSRGGDPEKIYVAQAGRVPCNYIALDKIFSPGKIESVKFYVHD